MARTIAEATGRAGLLVLREARGHLELISNGVFLMDTRDGRSERRLVEIAVEAVAHPVRRVLLGGLGLGFSLERACRLPQVEQIVVVEAEPAIVDWNRRYAAPRTGGDVDAPMVTCVVDDLVAVLRRPATTPPFDVVCLDTDNGPDWLVEAGNAWLYGDEGLAAISARLAPGGALSVWCAAPVPSFEQRLARHFTDVGHLDVEVARGVPDRVVVARR